MALDGIMPGEGLWGSCPAAAPSEQCGGAALWPVCSSPGHPLPTCVRAVAIGLDLDSFPPNLPRQNHTYPPVAYFHFSRDNTTTTVRLRWRCSAARGPACGELPGCASWPDPASLRACPPASPSACSKWRPWSSSARPLGCPPAKSRWAEVPASSERPSLQCRWQRGSMHAVCRSGRHARYCAGPAIPIHPRFLLPARPADQARRRNAAHAPSGGCLLPSCRQLRSRLVSTFFVVCCPAPA